MTDTQYQQLKKKIQEANPEIMELKFGCKVKLLLGDLYGETGFVITNCSKCRKHKRYSSCDSWCEFDDAVGVITQPDDIFTEYTFLHNEVESLGRPIRLADVLLAMPVEMELHHEPSGLHFRKKYAAGILNENEWIKWDLEHDSLSWHKENKPETVEFLINLLVQ